ncbi:MAG: c-type cytochrome [Alphaproteobacteria bacterium]|nr:c-type cytochrome [Alphaproteobacteria bacterium]
MSVKTFIAAVASSVALTGVAWAMDDEPKIDAEALYQQHCAECHAPTRLGALGPALLPGAIERLKPGKPTEAVIANGRVATQMEGFKDKLSAAEIKALAEYIYTEPAVEPKWEDADIKESHTVHKTMAELVKAPVHRADPLNIFTVVEMGDHHVTILNGHSFEPMYRFKTHFAVHGGAKYSPDGRFVYLSSRDGWITKHDLWGLEPVAEVRAGLNTRNIAVSSDGKWVMVGNYLPHNVVILNAEDLSLYRVVPTTANDGSKTSRVSAVYDAEPRQSFVVALKDIKEVWEMSYDPDAAPVYGGLIHSYRKGQEEATEVEPQPFARRRIMLDDYMDDFYFDPSYAEIMGASHDGKGGMVYNLDARKKVAELDLEGMPHLGSGIVAEYQGHMVMATPHLKKSQVSIIDMETWKTVKTIDTKGPGFFMRGHENSPYAWVDVFFGPNKDLLHVIDLRTLEIVREINPAPGKTNAHVEFTRDGRYALISVMEDQDKGGALVVYDAHTFEEVKRIPMNKPVGKYNVHNKITRSAGTSH